MTRVILLDIEGTTSSVSFVHDTLFPYARKHLYEYLQQHWGEPELDSACQSIVSDAGSGSASNINDVEQAVAELMDRDAKLTGLKQLQGRIWKSGFESGQLEAHVYPDAPAALQQWKSDALRVFIYSSGSIEAQKLFFAHTIAGDLSNYIDGNFDTTIGGKREESSYIKIAEAIGEAPEHILFISDIEAELDAARAAGMRTALAVRGDSPNSSRHQTISSFDELFLPQ
ncbi:MAG TPA: acireductone synthase [Planktothrix sp.]